MIATGEQHSVRDFVNFAAEEVGIDDSMGGQRRRREGLRCRDRAMHRRHRSAVFPAGRSRNAARRRVKGQAKLGWAPQTSFRELVSEMMREDLKLAERDELVKKHGFRFFNRHE